MKRYFIIWASLIFMLVSFAGCDQSAPLKKQSDAAVSTASPEDSSPVLTVNEAIWDQTFGEDGLAALLGSYTVTNLFDEGYWDTCVTPDRVSRLSKNNADELVAGGILANGDNCVVQYIFRQETGWEQGVYDETDTVEEYVEGTTRELIEILQVLSGKFEDAIWDEEQSAYIVSAEIPYSGPSLADPSQEKPTELVFEVFFADGKLSKVNVIEGESRSSIHSFGTTPVPQLPEV